MEIRKITKGERPDMRDAEAAIGRRAEIELNDTLPPAGGIPFDFVAIAGGRRAGQPTLSRVAVPGNRGSLASPCVLPTPQRRGIRGRPGLTAAAAAFGGPGFNIRHGYVPAPALTSPYPSPHTLVAGKAAQARPPAACP